MRLSTQHSVPARPRIHWPLLLAVWTVIGLILTAQALVVFDMPNEPWEKRRFDTVWLSYLQMMRAWLWALLTPLVFELRRRIPVRGAWLPFGVLLHVAFSCVLMEWVMLARAWIWAALPLPEPWAMSFIGLDELIHQLNPRVLIDIVAYAGVLVAGYIVDLVHERGQMQRRLASTELEQEKLRSALVQAEMKALKQQLHPHFLFNALNAVAGLVRLGENNEAVEALARISSLLRALIGSTGRPVVSLEEELAYCRTYLEIEKMRFDVRLNFSLTASPEALAAEVPTLLLQPMVENAIKHGIACRRNPGWVRLHAERRAGRLCVEVTNDPAETTRGASSAPSHGVGLSTTRERMMRAFGTDFRLDFELRQPAETIVRLEIPYQRRPDSTPASV